MLRENLCPVRKDFVDPLMEQSICTGLKDCVDPSSFCSVDESSIFMITLTYSIVLYPIKFCTFLIFKQQ